MDIQQTISRPALLRATKQGLSEFPAVALLGARQTGKTTLAQLVAATWPEPTTVFDLENPADRQALSMTPDRLLRRCTGLVVLDEVQRLPELFEVLRPICDDSAREAVFLLLGSASWDLVKGISETLAGRVHLVDVGGFSLAEAGSGNLHRLWLRGSFPRAFLAPTAGAWVRWMESFTRTFLERDIPALGSRVSPAALRRFWLMLAHYHSQIWNASALGQSMDVGPAAANQYRDLLAGTFMVRVLPPWFENLGKRLVRSPRVYVRDPGILHFLLGLENEAELPVHPQYGASWEGFALEQTLLAHGHRNAYFYRTQRGAELDLLLIRRTLRWGFEFKCTDAPRTTKSMRIVMDDLGLEHLWVVYPGQTEYPLDTRITALPLDSVRDLRLRPVG